MEARYLRVKKWSEKQHYPTEVRRPPWIKLYNTTLKSGEKFMELTEAEQWQLVRIWLVASHSEVLTLDEKGKQVPVLPLDERSLRRSTMGLRPLPLAKFIREGWLIPVDAHELLGDSTSDITVDSADAIAPLYKERSRKRKKKQGAVSDAHAPDHEQPLPGNHTAKIIDLSLREGTA